MPVRLRVPATSANLGPGFDALGLAMDFGLTLQADVAERDSIVATGRNAQVCADTTDSLLLSTYKDVLAQQGIEPPPLAITLHNEIPLGMGCGSSAAALVAGVSLAAYFGKLGWSKHQVLTEASLREGHPDNVAACVLGGLTVSAMRTNAKPATVTAVSLMPPARWKLLLVMPPSSLSTSKARAMLPAEYAKADVIANLQSVSLLTAAFALGRGDLLKEAMADRVHQPYRAAACPLLPALLPLAGQHGVLGVALSGAGPSVLLVTEESANVTAISGITKDALLSIQVSDAELLWTRIAGGSELPEKAAFS